MYTLLFLFSFGPAYVYGKDFGNLCLWTVERVVYKGLMGITQVALLVCLGWVWVPGFGLCVIARRFFFSFLFECVIMWVGCLQSQCVRGLESSFRLASLLATSRYRYYACSDAFRGVGRSFIHHGWSGVLVLISARCCSCIAVVVDYQCCTTAIERYWVIAHAV
jgi:hypothetical protein